jgi:hypothetical protein
MSGDKTIGGQLSQEEFRARVRTARLSDAEPAQCYGRDARPAPDALPADAIQEQLESLVYLVLAMRRSVRPAAEALACFAAVCVMLFLAAIQQVCRASLDLAYHLCVQGPEVLHFLPDENLHDWLNELQEVCDQKSAQRCIRVMQQVEDYRRTLRECRGGALHGGHERFHRGLDQRGAARVAGAALRVTGAARGPLFHLRRFRLHPHALRACSRRRCSTSPRTMRSITASAASASKDCSRMGVTIRHLTMKLLEAEACTPVLAMISDAGPDDEDRYRGD